MTQTLHRENPDARADSTAAGIEIEYFTDPLCCWSWAFEPQWRRLRYEFADHIAWRYRMGGMIPDWSSYHDPINSITRPSQMGPLWFQVRELSGMPLEDRIWMEDPPRSSYPASVAVKAAELQSPEAAEAYLRRLREAAVTGRQNVARPDVLLAVATELGQEQPALMDAARFAEDLESPQAEAAFREDLRAARYLEIGRFPTLILRRAGEERGLLLVGYRPYDALRSAFEHACGGEAPSPRRASSAGEYQQHWGRLYERELEEALGS